MVYMIFSIPFNNCPNNRFLCDLLAALRQLC